jgi:prepilin-type N-terminal cleavage/methylation domain-containing protein
MRNKKGFTLIELMVVMAIIAVLTVLGFFGIRQAQASARDSGRVKVMSLVRTQLEQYFSDNQTYPVLTSRFDSMVATLSNSGALKDPGCGSGQINYSAAGGNITAGAWTPVPTGCSFSIQPSYQYSGTATGYTLVLTKEGGGQVTYSAPQ